MTEADLLARMDALLADAEKCNALLAGDKLHKVRREDISGLILAAMADGHQSALAISEIVQYGRKHVTARLHYMASIGYAEHVARGVYAITDKGRDTLAKVAK